MTDCNKKKAKPSIISNLKSSIFCGVKGFLTFNLALLSYLEHSNYKLEYGNYEEVSTKDNSKKQACRLACAVQTDGTTVNQSVTQTVTKSDKKESSDQQYILPKDNFTFTMKRNAIPFLEMTIILPLVCFGLPAICNISLMQCALICAALMIITCFIVRAFNLREKLLEKTTNYNKETIHKEINKDSIIYPIFDKNNKYIRYNSPNAESLLIDKSNVSYYSTIFIIFPLKVLQSCILLSLAAVELLETIPSVFIDMFCDRNFQSTKSNLQKSGHLLYASVRTLIPLSRFDESVAEFIGTPKETCCGV